MSRLDVPPPILSVRRALALAIAIVLTHRLLMVLTGGNPGLRTGLNDIGQVLLTLAVAVGLFYVARRPAGARRVQAAWALLGAGMSLALLGAIAYALVELSGQNPFRSIADGFFLMFYPLFAAGLILMAGDSHSAGERARVFVDLAIVMIAAFLAFWVIFFAPVVSAQPEADPLTRAVAVAYLVGDWTLVFAVLWVLFSRPGQVRPAPLLLLALAGISQVAADVLYFVHYFEGAYVSGGWVDSLYALNLSLLVVVIALHLAPQAQDATGRAPGSGVAGRQFQWAAYLPYLGVAIAYVLLLWAHNRAIPMSFGALAWVVGGIIGLVVLRQIGALRENTRLGRQLQAQLAEREAAEQAVRRLNEELESRVLERTATLTQEIAERKRAEEALQMFRFSIDQAPDAIFWLDRQAGYAYVNDEACRSLGYAREELMGLRLWDIDPVYPPDTWNWNWDQYEQTRQGGTERVETVHRRRDGVVFPVEVVAQHIWFGDRPLHVAYVRDITERKQADSILQRYQLLSQHARDIILFIRASDGQILEANDAAARAYGYDRQELLTRRIHDLRAPETQDLIARQIGQANTAGILFETTHRRRDGSLFPVEVSSVGMTWGDDRVLLSTIRDITERKQAEEALRESEFFLQKSQAVARLGSYLFDARTGQWISSPMLDEIFGLPADFPKDVAGWIAVVHPEHKEEMLQYLTQHVVAGHNRFDREYRILRQTDGQERWVHGIGELEFDEHGNTIKMIGTIQDVTESRQMEQALRQNEERLQQAVRAAGIGFFDHDHRTGALYRSLEERVFFGWGAEEALQPSAFFDQVHPEDRERVEAAIQRSRDPAGDGSYEVEHRIIRRDGAVRWLAARSQTYFEAEGGARRPVRTVGAALDITERKQAEETLRTHSQILLAMAEGVTFVDPRGIIRFTNPAFDKMFGYAPGELLGQSAAILNAGTPEESARLVADIAETVQHGQVQEREFVNRKKDGTVFYTWARISATQVAGEAWRVTVQEDVTERKRTEAVLRESEARWRSLVSNAPAVIMTVDADGWILSTNRSISGREVEQVVGTSMLDYLRPEDRERVRQAVEAVFRDGAPQSYEIHGTVPSGAEFWFETHLAAIRPADEVEAAILVSVDITERKRAEQALRESERRLALVFNSTSDMQLLYRVEPDDRLIVQAANQAHTKYVRRVFPDAPADVVGKSRTEFLTAFGVSPEMIEREMPRLREVVERRAPVHYEAGLPTPTGAEAVEVSLEPVLDAEGRCSHVLWTGRDIAERKQAEAQLKASLQEKEVLLKEIHHRVKNNLQVISSLLYLQSRRVQNPQAQAMYRESRNRIAAMALIHEKLYQSPDLAQISFAEYARDLAQSLFLSHGTDPAAVSLAVEAGHLTLDINSAVPCGLIVNEVISNSLKHAFPGGRAGAVRIELSLDREDRYHLILSDDGVGLPADFQERAAASLGVRLIERLVGQLRGSLERSAGPGTRYHISFPRDV